MPGVNLLSLRAKLLLGLGIIMLLLFAQTSLAHGHLLIGQAAADAIEHTQLVLRADPDRLQQTLTNLLSNAIKFSPAGSSIDVRGRLKLGPTEFLTRARIAPEEVRRRVLTLLERVVPAA